MESTNNLLDDLDDLVRGDAASVPEDLLWTYRVIRNVEKAAINGDLVVEPITAKGTLELLNELFEGKYPLEYPPDNTDDIEPDGPGSKVFSDGSYNSTTFMSASAYSRGVSFVSQGLYASEAFFIRAAFLRLKYDKLSQRVGFGHGHHNRKKATANVELISSIPMSVGTVANTGTSPSSLQIRSFSYSSGVSSGDKTIVVSKGDLVSLWTEYNVDKSRYDLTGAITPNNSHPFKLSKLWAKSNATPEGHSWTT